MRTIWDRVRHAVTFELVALAIFTPGAALLLERPVTDTGLVGAVSATVATVWTFVFNLVFDRTLLRLRGSADKTMAIRAGHAMIFEAGLAVLLVPVIAAILDIGLMEALAMDLGVVAFYLAYAFIFNLAYDWLFPAAPVMPCAGA
ncbi:PACE efflux transporter [Poseidonocella sp. HB161398]|uniref:PACE efflux transporter n=1 Tax=Poseidonocella sp. HB161398 TaxID=2320855 RepID=UPI00110889DB|nr:PACE efflux transporter [Poseidonocella sp. HB161398]